MARLRYSKPSATFQQNKTLPPIKKTSNSIAKKAKTKPVSVIKKSDLRKQGISDLNKLNLKYKSKWSDYKFAMLKKYKFALKKTHYCPKCYRELTKNEIIANMLISPEEYGCVCPLCNNIFIPRLYVSAGSNFINAGLWYCDNQLIKATERFLKGIRFSHEKSVKGDRMICFSLKEFNDMRKDLFVNILNKVSYIREKNFQSYFDENIKDYKVKIVKDKDKAEGVNCSLVICYTETDKSEVLHFSDIKETQFRALKNLHGKHRDSFIYNDDGSNTEFTAGMLFRYLIKGNYEEPVDKWIHSKNLKRFSSDDLDNVQEKGTTALSKAPTPFPSTNVIVYINNY